jgi:hypothetical protein
MNHANPATIVVARRRPPILVPPTAILVTPAPILVTPTPILVTPTPTLVARR